MPVAKDVYVRLLLPESFVGGFHELDIEHVSALNSQIARKGAAIRRRAHQGFTDAGAVDKVRCPRPDLLPLRDEGVPAGFSNRPTGSQNELVSGDE